jgi:replication-associated recombination protein RarA
MVSRSNGFQKKLFEDLQVDKVDFANSRELKEGETPGFIYSSTAADGDAKLSNKPFSNVWPKSFSEIVGNQSVITRLAETLAVQMVPRVTIFHGLRGVGKTSIGQICARKYACGYFDINSCLFSSCWSCSRHNSTWFTNIDCARTESSDIKKNILQHANPFFMHAERRVFFLDEMNYKKANDISVFLTRFVEDAYDVVFLVACNNEGVGELDLGLRTRAVLFKFEEPGVFELTSWLYKYAHSVKIPISLFNAYTIVKSIRPEGIPREALKQLVELYKRNPSCFDDRLEETFSLKGEKIAGLKARFSKEEAACQKELENWD